MILNEFFNNPELDEGAEFGSYYSEELAQKVFDLNPNLSTAGRADELLDAAWPIAVEDLGKKSAQYKFSYDEDFPSDFVSMYAQLQKQGVSEASRGKYHANTTGFARGARDDERHDLDQERAQIEKSGTWYIRLNGKLIRDKQGTPYTYRDKAAANKAAVTMQAKLFNQGKEFVLTTNPNDPQQGVAEGEKEADYGSDHQAMVKRVGQMAKQGERKTVWDPVKRVYKTVPVTQSKEQGVAEGSAETVPWKEAQKVLNHYGADYFGTGYDKLYFYKYRKRFSIGLIRDEDGNGNHSVNLSELNDMVRKLRGMRVPLSPFEEGMAEADMSRRGFLKGLGAAAVAGAAGGAMAQSTQQQDLGNGFVLTTIDVAGHTVKAVLDTQTGLSFTLNRGSNGSAIIRSQARFLTIKDGKIVDTSMSVGPATTTAMKKAGLVQEGVAEGLDDNVPADRGEYDQEGEMAQQDLTTAVDAAEELRSILSADENLPEWVQAKITKAVDYLDTTRDYMKSKEPELNESRLHRLNLLKTILIQTP